MKSCLGILLITLCLTASSPAKELAANSGFEDAKGSAESPFADWNFYGGFEHGRYAISISNEAHTGRNAAQISCLKKGRAGLSSKELTLEPGTVIEASCWLKAKEANGGRVFLNFEGTPGDGWASQDLKTGTYEWTQFRLRAVVPKSKSGVAQKIVVYLYTSCEGAIWVDDFSIQQLDAQAGANAPVAAKGPAPIAEPADSAGYRVAIVSPLEKVFHEDPFADLKEPRVEVSAARNEFESAQVVIEAPWRPVNVPTIEVSDLKGPGGAVIPKSAATWNRVGYVETTVTPPYFAERGLGSYPDPLLPAGTFTVEKLSRVPLWLTFKTPKDCAAGIYTGTITIRPEKLRPTTIPVTLTVWDFALTDQTHLRTLTWLASGGLREWYQLDESPAGEQKLSETLTNYQNCLLDHRLGPGGEVAAHLRRGADGKFDFRETDASLERLIARGMNAFIMGTAPNLAREKKTEYAPEFIQQFTQMLKAYGDHLREKGWLNMAYVYVYDEAPKAAWPEVKKIDQAIRVAVPQARILQCLNDPEGVRALTGFADVFDVYVPHYHQAGVAQSQAKGAEVWLAACCYPMDHPNFFLEYPLLDVRIIPWVCWKHQAGGFEYWSTTAWGPNARKKSERWPQVPWIANAFGKYNGDGYLVYPGADLQPYSSLRLEALRDGLEDYEYFWTLNALVQKAEGRKLAGAAVETARELLSTQGPVKEAGSYSTQGAEYLDHRRKLAETIVALRKLIER